MNRVKNLPFIDTSECNMKLHRQFKYIGETPLCTPMSQNIMTAHRSERCSAKRQSTRQSVGYRPIRLDICFHSWTPEQWADVNHYVRIHIVMEEPPALHIHTLIKNTVWLLMRNDEVKIT